MVKDMIEWLEDGHYLEALQMADEMKKKLNAEDVLKVCSKYLKVVTVQMVDDYIYFQCCFQLYCKTHTSLFDWNEEEGCRDQLVLALLEEATK